MTNYITPFEERIFGARFRAVFEFAKQNFVSAVKYNLLLFIVLGALFGWLITILPDNPSGSSILRILAQFSVFFVCLSYFTHYIENKGNMSSTSFKQMFASSAIAFGKMFIAGILPFIAGLIIGIPIALLIVTSAHFGGGGTTSILLSILLLLFLLLVLYLLPIMNIYYVHFYFSCSFKNMIGIFKESYRMVKGHWWSTFLFGIIWGYIKSIAQIPLVVVLLLPLMGLQDKVTLAILTGISLALSYIGSFFTTDAALIFQYGHLKALKEKQEIKEEEADTVAENEILE